jgi:CRISPR-associated protein Cmr1
MYAAEQALWGGPSRHGLINLTVEKSNTTGTVAWNNEKIKYATFPLEDHDHEHLLKSMLPTGVSFSLVLHYPPVSVFTLDKDATPPLTQTLNVADEVNAALWAWTTFGGIGARTRRGLGAIHCLTIDGEVQIPPFEEGLTANIQKGLTMHAVAGAWPPDVPHLTPQTRFVLRVLDGPPIVAWEYLIRKLKQFRQSRNGGIHRSHWPEPDEIRRLSGTYMRSHAPEHAVTPYKFPRGDFGLPIVFKFVREDVARRDPEQTTLEGARNKRLASPLLLRPLKCSPDGSSDVSIALAAILEGCRTPPGGYVLRGGHLCGNTERSAPMGTEVPVYKDLSTSNSGSKSSDDADTVFDKVINNSTLRAKVKATYASSTTDLLQAFLTYLEG